MNITPWIAWCHRIRRICQGLAVLLIVALLGQGWGLVRMRAAVASQPPMLAEDWLSPPVQAVEVRLDQLHPVTPAPAAAVPLATGPHLRLQGIAFGESPRAYLVDERGDQTLTVRPGDRIGPVTIRSIQERTVVIEQEGATYELRL